MRFPPNKYSKKTSKLEVSDRIAKIRELYKNEKMKGEKSGECSTPSAEECVMWRDGLDILSGKKSAPNGVDINASMSIVEGEDNKRIVEALLGTCGNPTLQSFVNLAQVAGEKELKTCNASSNKYS